MSDRQTPEPATRTPSPDAPADRTGDKEFHLWRLLAGLAVVILALMVVAAIVNVIVLGW